MAARRTKRSDGRFVVTVSYQDENGKKQRAFLYGRTQAEANQKARELRDRAATGAPVRDASRPLADWLREWVTTCLEASSRARSTKIMHAAYVRVWLIPILGDVPLAQLNPSDITRLLLAMQQAGKSSSTQRNCHDTLSSALNDAVRNSLLAANAARKVPRPSVRREEARYLRPDEVQEFLIAVDRYRYAPALKLILGTGLRRGEAAALRWDDVDLGRAEARVRGSLVRQEGGLVVSHTKTLMSQRRIALSPAVVSLLRDHKANQDAERQRAANQWQESGFVFASELGRPVDPQNLLRTVVLAARTAGLSDVTVHCLRHTYATTALMNGVPLKTVSVNLGHASIQITADIYGHVTDEAARSAAETVSAALGL